MKELLDAARNGDFVLAKEIFDRSISDNISASSLLNETDGRGKSVGHYAVLFDDVVVVEWLYNMGCDFFVRDDSNKSAIEIAVLVDAKMKRKLGQSSEVLEFFRKIVLNKIQQIFYIESCESAESVTNISDLTSLTNDSLSERFPYHNNMQAIHVFAIHDRFEELEYMKSRGIDMKGTDDDGNSILHFAVSKKVLEFGIVECGLDPNLKNHTDGYSAAHAVVEKIGSDEIDEQEGLDMLKFVAEHGGDFTIECDEPCLNVAELALECLGKGAITLYCAQKISSATGVPVDEILNYEDGSEDDYSDISVASHNKRVLNEDGEYTDGEEDQSDSSDDSSELDNQDSQDESASEDSSDSGNMFAFRKK
jgi:hypothetical protein